MVKSRAIAFILALCLVFSCCFTASAETVLKSGSKGYIDNSSLMPPYVTDDKVKLISINGGKLQSPEWIKTLVIEEVNVQYCSPNGKFSGMTYVLDHLQEMGVNGIWLDPIYGGPHYLNYGPATVDSYITGTNDPEEGWKVVAKFVEEAHKRNIRVFLDIITWGICRFAPLFEEKPEWFGKYNERYTGYEYNWANPELTEWFANELIDIVRKTDIDGYRCDCGIAYGCRKMYEKVRSELYAEGNYIVLIGESVSDDTADIFDFSEHSCDYDLKTEGEIYINGELKMPDVVKKGFGFDTLNSQFANEGGKKTFYTSLVSCHDTQKYMVKGNIVNIAYSAILAPFIPLWYCGEEWNNTYSSTGWLWSTGVYWNEIENNRDFFEKVKAYMRIRRLYPEIFNYYPDNHRETNICEVATDRENPVLVSYARYADGKGILVIPNQGEDNSRFKVTIPYKDMGLNEGRTYSLVNLLTGKLIGTGKGTDLTAFSTTVEDKNVGVYLVRPAEKNEKITVTAATVQNTVKDNINDNENSGDSAYIPVDNNAENNGDIATEKEKVSTVQKKKVPGKVIYENYIPWGVIIGIAAGIVVIAAAITAFIIYKKKKKTLQS